MKDHIAARRHDRRTATGPSSRVRACLLAVIGAWSLLPGCAQPPQEGPRTPRLVLLYLPCSVNRGFLGPYNAEVEYTPNLSRWAESGVVLERHQTEGGQSGVAYASILSGARSSHHGVFTNGTILRDSVELIAESFGQAGYETFGWLSHRMASQQFNYDQGVPAKNLTTRRLTSSSRRFRKVLRRLRRNPDYRALIVVNFTNTHSPYRHSHVDEFCDIYPGECGPDWNRSEFMSNMKLHLDAPTRRALSWDFPNTAPRLGLTGERLAKFAEALELAYKSNVFHLDRLFGEIVDAVDRAGLIEESLIAFTADHGELLYRDNALFQWAHGLQLAPEVLTVPGLLLAPGLLEPRRYGGVTRAIDLFPTVAAFAGASAPRGAVFGRDLSAALRGEEAPPDLLAFSHSTLAGPAEATPLDVFKLTMFRDQDPKYLWVGVRSGDLFFRRVSSDGERFETEAFDLASDPELRRDIFDRGEPRDLRMEEMLIRYREELIRGYWEHLRTESPEESEARLDALKALGYIQ